MNVIKLCKMLWNIDEWEIEFYHGLEIYKHSSGYHTYVGYSYYRNGDRYDPPIFMDAIIVYLFIRLQDKLRMGFHA